MTEPLGLPRCLFPYGCWSRNQVDESARHTLQWGPASLAMPVTIFLSLAQYTVLALFALVVGEWGSRSRRAWAWCPLRRNRTCSHSSCAHCQSTRCSPASARWQGRYASEPGGPGRSELRFVGGHGLAGPSTLLPRRHGWWLSQEN